MFKSPLSILTLALTASFPLSIFAAEVPAGVTLADTQELVRGNDAEAPTLNPLKAEGIPEMHILRDLFEGLVIQNQDGSVVPGVAERWETKDNQTYTFHLRKDAKWSNGDPVTAQDFVYSLHTAASPQFASPNAWYLKLTGIKNAQAIIDGKKPVDSLGVKAIDAHTLQFQLDKPVPYFVAMTAHTVMMPINQKAVKKFGDNWTKPENMVSNGAYKLQNWVINERLEMVRNPNYWDNNDTVINKVTYIPFESQTAAMNRYLTGEVDITSDVPVAMVDKLKKDHPEAYKITPLLCTYYYALNTERKPFNDARARKAISYTIMRDVISNGITKGNVPAYTFAHQDVANFKATQPEYSKWTQQQRDVEAKKLLKAAGYDNANPLKATLLYNTSENHKAIATAIASMLHKNLGMDITLDNQEWKSYLAARQQRNFDIMRASWCGDYNEASTFLSLLTSGNDKNFPSYASLQYDEALEKAQSAVDLQTRNQYYDQAEQILAQDMPIAPIYYFMQSRLVNPKLGGYPMHNAEGRIYSKDLYFKAK
ncbi:MULTISPECIES: peptide ABC transporter substrate-binding protein [Vibrio]|uniref:Peptide ABC transporter substrate-binding protein n=1 Tax=Vibrio casei TaxID=673372 RepID=A0A368LK48_9VIBR|nr:MULTISPECIES: peptide ABC transporter substrate-binding protein [Vibrio]RCS70723.1 peptide ABC transporter substrate-binding protein [Vibrio casei]SJN26642.1 Oligopeptide ABC transporter, periplasmic oligopeptide-binding protein OppA (TC 3.A.1.5.1) [Vibrio casei]HBV77557.1 peptide ABC transporter substrate-binding protein [Vibrio sp.]